MAKKKYRISKPNLMGGSVQQSKEGMQNMQTGGTTATDQQQMQAFMASVYRLFKDGMTSSDVEYQLSAQGYPYEFVQNAIKAVQNYMNSIGEPYEQEQEMPTDLAGMAPQAPMEQESEQSKMNAAKMDQYGQQSMDTAMEDDEEFDELLNRENPYMQEGGEMEAEEPSLPYFPNQEIVMATGPSPYNMGKGGKVSRKKFMKNVLKRFEEGGPKETPLSSAPKKDTLEKDVEKATKGFVSAVQGKAKESVAKEMYKLVEESGDPKLQQMLMSGDQQQPMQPMAREGMMVNGDDEPIAGQYPMTQAEAEAEAESNAFYPTPTGEYPNPLDRLSGTPGLFAKRIARVNQQNAMNKIGDPRPRYNDYMNIQEYDRKMLDQTLEDKVRAAQNAKRKALQEAYLDGMTEKPRERSMQDFINPKQELGGMQYADNGAIVDPGGQTYQEYIDWYNNNENASDPEKTSTEAPMSEQEFNDAYGESTTTDPDKKYELGKKVYDTRYEYAATPGRRGLFDALFPANRALGYRPKYYVDPRLGKPVARDVYGRTLFGGKKYIDYYEMPDEDFDPQILRRKDINKRARKGNKAMRKVLKGKGPIADALDLVLNRDDAGNDMGVDATDPSTLDRVGSRMAVRRGERRARNKMGLAGKGTLGSRGLRPASQSDISTNTDAELERIMNEPAGSDGQAPILETMMDNPTDFNAPDVQSIEGNVTEDDVLAMMEQYPDEFIDEYSLTGEEQMRAASQNRAKALELMQRMPNVDNQFIQYMADPRSQAGRFSYGTGGALDKFVLGGFDPTESYKDPYAYNIEMDNPSEKMIDSDIESFKAAQNAIEGDEEGGDEKRKLIGVKNKDKLGISSGQNFLNPFNALSNRVVGALGNIGEERREADVIEEATDPLNAYTAIRAQDRGDFNIYGDFRLDEQGFEGSTNNEGPTSGGAAKKGGSVYSKNQVVEMSLPEMQAFMDAGGTLEFL